MLSTETWEKVDDIVFNIYRAQNLADLRWGFMRDLAEVVPFQSIFSDLRLVRRGKDLCLDPISLDMSEEELAAYYDTFITKDFTSWATSQSQVISAYRDSDFISDAARLESELYQKWMRPRNILYGSCINIAYEGIDYATVTLGRSEQAGDFTADDIEVLKVLARHLGLKYHLLFPAGIPYPEKTSAASRAKAVFRLTDRETEVCQLVCQGLSAQEAAGSLSISVHTLNRHLANIYKKTNVGSRIALMRKLKDVVEP